MEDKNKDIIFIIGEINMDVDVFGNLFGNSGDYKIFKSRKPIPFKRGKGVMSKCIETYIDILKQKHRKTNQSLDVRCSQITELEESFFDNFLMELIFDEDYVNISEWNTELNLILSEFSKMTGLTAEEAIDILYGYTMINIKITDELNESFYLASSPFVGAKSRPRFNAETGMYDDEYLYFSLSISPEFYEACKKEKRRMGVKKNL